MYAAKPKTPPPSKKQKFLKSLVPKDGSKVNGHNIVKQVEFVLDDEQLHMDEETFQKVRHIVEDELKFKVLVPPDDYGEVVKYTNLAECKQNMMENDKELLIKLGKTGKARMDQLYQEDPAILEPTEVANLDQLGNMIQEIYDSYAELQQPTTAATGGFTPAQKAKVAKYFMSFMATNPSYTKNVVFIQLVCNGAIMLWHLKDQIDLRANVKGDASLTETFHGMAQKYVSGFVVTMLYCFVRGPKTGGQNKRHFRLGHLHPNNPYTIWVANPLLTLAKKMFGQLFMLSMAKKDSPHKYIERLKSQQKKYGIHSLLALQRNIGSKPDWVHGLYLEVHHLTSLLTTHHQFQVPPRMEESQLLHFEDEELEECKVRTKLRPPLIIPVEDDKPFEICPLPYDAVDNEDDMEDQDG